VICPGCGVENPATAKFCSECATRLISGCPSCGATNAPGAKFCNECGFALRGGVSTPGSSAGAKVGAPVAAVDASVRDAVAPVAQRRLVSILFADLVGFTSLAQDRDPEATRELLTRYFELAQELIGRYGGTVEKFIGDAVMAVWGAPTAHEDDAERAVRAAMELVSAVPTLERGLTARAGVLTGEAAVTIGATNQGMVAGDLVNTASRLQSAAAPGDVLVGEATQRAASAAIVFEPAGEQVLKGKTAPVPAWRARRVVAEVGGRRRAGTLEAPFVGREDELRLLKDLFHATGRERRLRLVSITGQAGIGKSRLAWEFEKYLDGVVDTVWWHHGRSPAYGEGITFWALGEMVRGRAGLVETDDAETTQARLAETLAQWVPDETERRRIGPALLALLGVGEVPAGGREDLFTAWRTFFERIAERGPVGMLFEDLHWADPGLLDFIDHLLEWSRGLPIYIVTLARPELLERRPQWGAGKRNFVSIDLEPLPEPAMRRLLAGLVPGLPEPAVKAIVTRAEGMPLYAVETVRMLVSEGRLVEEAGEYRPEGDLSSLSVPETLQALIAARLDALDPTDRSLLQQAAVIGSSFSTPALSAVSGLEPVELETRLRVLVRRELLTLDTDPRSPERGQHTFVQALLRDVAYNTLARPDRKRLHLAAARYFETLGLDELAGALASHSMDAYRNASEGPEADALAGQARIALRAAAERAAALGSHDQAIAFLRQALEVTPDAIEAADLQERIAVSAMGAGRYAVAEDALGTAAAAYAGVDPESWLRATAALGHAFLAGARVGDAIALLDAAVAAMPEDAENPAAAAVYAALAAAWARSADPTRTLHWAERALVIAERHEDVSIVAAAISTKAYSLNQLDRRFEVTVVLDGLVRFADRHALTRLSLESRLILAYAMWDDDPPAAYALMRSGLELAERAGDRDVWLRQAGGAAAIGYSVGDWDAVAATLEEAVSGSLEGVARYRITHGRWRLLRGRGVAADALLDDLREILTSGPTDTAIQGGVHGVLAEHALLEGRYADARQEALRMVEAVAAYASEGLSLAFRGALWGRDFDSARSTLAAMEASASHGRWPDADTLAMRAGVAALDGRAGDAVSLYRDAIRRFRDLGMAFELARCLGDAAVALGQTDPDGRAAADEARTILGQLGAQAYLERLAVLLSAPGGVTGAAATVRPARTESPRTSPV
jgi:class 3 adenylate cyclase/tetratricopeptide (TPR) repeat protein